MHSSFLRRIWLNFMAQYLFFFGFYNFHIFFFTVFQNFGPSKIERIAKSFKVFRVKYKRFKCKIASNESKVNTIPILMHQMRISTNEVSSVVLEPKKLEVEKKNCEKCKEPKEKPYCAMKLSQVRRRKELCMREISFVSRWIYEIYF